MKQTPITQLFKIKYPIIQGGMAWASHSDLAAAVSSAGGLGILGSSTMSVDELGNEINKVRSKSDKPFGVNVVIMSPEPDEKIAMAIEKKVPIVITAAGSPKKYTAQLKEAGITVGHVVPSAKLAEKTEGAGVDFIVAESTEAGGHDGLDEISNLTLIPLVRSRISLPLVAAGGIVNGQQIAAALLLGADGVQIGTRFVASNECQVHERFKKGILEAGEADTLFVARCYKPQRILRNSFAEEIQRLECDGATAEEIRDAYGPNRGKMGCVEGDWQEGYFNCGQGAALIDKVLSVKEIFDNFLNEYDQAGSSLGA